jgi:predicted 2-oxoglutarate/Fe(II)-dependent dioxygenase YbiX/peroxiredoxin
LVKRPLLIGEPAPWFHAAALSGSPNYAFSTAAGRWILMLFVGQAEGAAGEAALQVVAENRDLFDDRQACFFGVTVDPADAEQGRIAQMIPGIRWFLDYERRVSEAYGACPSAEASDAYAPCWVLLDPMQRFYARAPLAAGGQMIAQLRQLAGAKYSVPAPVLVVPGVLPPQMCERLIALYDEHGGAESGFMREVDGVTRLLVDHEHKRRNDYMITDEQLLDALQNRLFRVLRPLVQRAFQFEATRVERWIVARYDAAEGGFFRAHRDNTTKGTAHRKFAVTINLNAHAYEGGDLCFPEFGPQTYRAPTGGAIVFSCSLLHEARPVTKGTRYAFLPFLYDDAGAELREQNLPFLSPELRGYRSGLTQ